jgi:hypothetical protein
MRLRLAGWVHRQQMHRSSSVPRETLANLSITGHLRCFSDQPVAEIVQCGEPTPTLRSVVGSRSDSVTPRLTALAASGNESSPRSQLLRYAQLLPAGLSQARRASLRSPRPGTSPARGANSIRLANQRLIDLLLEQPRK